MPACSYFCIAGRIGRVPFAGTAGILPIFEHNADFNAGGFSDALAGAKRKELVTDLSGRPPSSYYENRTFDGVGLAYGDRVSGRMDEDVARNKKEMRQFYKYFGAGDTSVSKG